MSVAVAGGDGHQRGVRGSVCVRRGEDGWRAHLDAALDLVRGGATLLVQTDKVPAPVGIAQRLARAADDLGQRILSDIVYRCRAGSRGLLWAGDPRALGIRTRRIAPVLGITARTPERAALSHALTALRKSGRLHFEYDPAFDREGVGT